MASVIEVRNLSKKYTIGACVDRSANLREVLTQALLKPLAALRNSSGNGHRTPVNNSFWALRNVSLDVEKGDTLAIIGSNGAGKSTLLKILSRITDPTEGRVKIRGRLASLLEVGTGFHAELTGRENIYLNGSILGMRKAEMDAKFDEIVNFSGIGRFLDTPVKRYSSGMYVRLAFAIAAHLEPEILVVDEVLAVGDAAFQKKCLGKMAQACAQARTVIFVSHNLAAVEALCNKAIVLQQGSLVFAGTAKEGIQYYLHNLSTQSSAPASHILDLSSAAGRPMKYRPLLKRVEFYTEDDQPFLGELRIGAPLKAVIHFYLEEPCSRFDAVIGFNTASGQRICTAASAYEPDRAHEDRVGEQVFVCDIPSIPLVPGEYRIGVGLEVAGDEMDWVDDVARLNILRSDYYGTGIVPTRGAFLLRNRWALADVKRGAERENVNVTSLRSGARGS
jgi:lipopolysaccharide transport system ATP-binding protein